MKFSHRILAIGLALAAVCGFAAAAGEPDFRLSEKTFFKPDTKFRNHRRVFAWYMLCCGPYNGGQGAPVAEYKKQIQTAQSMGIDGFGLDVMRPNAEYRASIAKMFQAAAELNTGFRLFFEFDYGNRMHREQVADMIALLKQYGSDAAYEKFDGVPLMGYYGADLTVDDQLAPSLKWWRDTVFPAFAEAGLKVFFVPTTFSQARGGATPEAVNASLADWGNLAAGMSIWMIQTSPFGGGLKLLENQSSALHKAGKTWMGTISFHYWWASSRSVPVEWLWMPGREKNPGAETNGTYYEHGGGKGLERQWQSVLNVQSPEWVMLLTWNDYNESYIEPVDDYKKYRNGTASGAPLGWYQPMTGLAELNRYYIQWYKTGVRPTITRDALFYCYRTSSRNLIAEADKRPPVRFGNPPATDDIYLTTALTAPAKLRVVSGDQTAEFDVPAGIAQTTVPFHPGPQVFSLWRGGREIVSAKGAPVADSIRYYSYWPTTGFAIVP